MTYNFEIFLFVIAGCSSLLAVFILFGTMLLKLFKEQKIPKRSKIRAITGIADKGPGTRIKAYGTDGGPTTTCSLPIHSEKRRQQQLW